MTQLARMAFDQGIDAGLSKRDSASVSPPSMLRADIRLSLHEDLAEIERDWRAFEVDADGTAFQSFDWLSTWQRHIGVREGVTPAIVIGEQGGQILFILPFAVEAGKALRRVTWLGAFLASSNAPVLATDFAKRVNPTQLALIWREIMQLLRGRFGHDLIDLSKIPATVGGQVNPMLALAVTAHANDTYVTNLAGTWDEFYQSKRSSSWRKTDGKKRRRLDKIGQVQFATAADAAEIESTLDALIDQKRNSYATLGVSNMFELPGYREFFLDMAGHRALVHVSSVTVDKTIVAASFGLTFHGNYDYVLAGYNGGEYEACSPGTIHLQELMRYFLERGFKTFDFNIGDEPYKREWCDVELKLYDYLASATVSGWGAAAIMRGARMTKRFIKRNPSIWPVLRKARSLVASLRAR